MGKWFAVDGKCHDLSGRVGEWLKPADCKSAAPCGLRRFESSPVHHNFLGSSFTSKFEFWLGGNSAEHAVAISRRQVHAVVSAKKKDTDLAWVAQMVERVLGKDEVTGSIPVPGSRASAVWRTGF
jgi:hypothetical protein